MEKKLCFFAEKGLTSTSANHVANLAKEYIQTIEFNLKYIKFYSETVELIDSDKPRIIATGINLEELNNINDYINQIADAKSLIAWLREAIKRKDSLLIKVNLYDLNNYCKDNNIEYPLSPVQKNALTEEEYYDSLSIKDRNRYYSLETKAAVIGKYIHPDSDYAQARKKLKSIIQTPCNIEGSGRDSIIHTKINSVSIEEVDDKFFELQDQHRTVQAELNSMKSKCKQAIDASTIECSADYTKEYQAYSNIQKLLNSQLKEYKVELNKTVSNMKIVIPNCLQDIYNKVTNLSK